MAFLRRSKRATSSQPNFQDTINEAGFSHIEMHDDAQRERFVELLKRPISATRFIDHAALEALGLGDAMKRMLKKSGCSGLYYMCEQTYRCLTLEFLSSYYYDEDKPAIHFRLLNNQLCLNNEQWGELLGCRSVGTISTTEPRDGTDFLYKALTGLERGGSIWKFKAHLIHHPLIRLWCRLVSLVYFGRSEPTNLKAPEIHMLFAYLNVDGGKKFKVNVGHFIAKHFELVASGVITPILVGGLVTHLAKSIFTRVAEDKLDLVPGTPTGDSITMDIPYLTKLLYIKGIDRNTWWWKLGRVNLVALPERGDTKKVPPVVRFRHIHHAQIDLSYYLLDPSTDRHHEPTPIDRPASEEDFTPVGVPTIDPVGDYSRFQHYPFQRAPYRPDGVDPLRLPPTFATYPPFAEPQVWNQNSRDAMLFGLCNQFQQATFNQTLANHNLYAYHANQGHFGENVIHPAFYIPQVPDPSNSAGPSHEYHSGPQGSSGHQQQPVSGHTDGQATHDDRWTAEDDRRVLTTALAAASDAGDEDEPQWNYAFAANYGDEDDQDVDAESDAQRAGGEEEPKWNYAFASNYGNDDEDDESEVEAEDAFDVNNTP